MSYFVILISLTISHIFKKTQNISPEEVGSRKTKLGLDRLRYSKLDLQAEIQSESASQHNYN